MVFIRRISPHTFLHLSTKKDAFCLRDYSAGPNVPPVEVLRHFEEPGASTATIQDEARQPGNKLLPVPGGVRVEDSAFWHKQTAELNRKHLPVAPPPPPAPPNGGDTADIKIDIRKGGVLMGVLRVSKTSITWHSGGQSTGSRLSWVQFAELLRQHGEPVGL